MDRLIYPKVEVLKAYRDKNRSEHSDFIVLYYFKAIRYQCKWQERQIDTLLEYINELEYRGIKYR